MSVTAWTHLYSWLLLLVCPRKECEVQQSACMSVCLHMSRTTSKLHEIFCTWQCNTLYTYNFVNDAMFSHNTAHVVYSEAYGWGTSVSRRQCREGWSFSASASPLSALPPADTLAVSLFVHNSLAVEANTMLHMWGKSPILNCLVTVADTNKQCVITLHSSMHNWRDPVIQKKLHTSNSGDGADDRSMLK